PRKVAGTHRVTEARARPAITGVEGQRGQRSAGARIELRIDLVDDLGRILDRGIEATISFVAIDPLALELGAGAVAVRELLVIPPRLRRESLRPLDLPDKGRSDPAHAVGLGQHMAAFFIGDAAAL